jgi:hypothetical protein
MKILLVFSVLLIGLVLFSFITDTSAGEPDRVATFDVRGVKLGMQFNDVQAIIKAQWPVFDKNYKEHNNPRSCWLCAGTSCGTITDYQIEVCLTDEPYGSGVYDISYKVQPQGSVDRQTFIGQLKADIRNKYGKPSYEVAPNPNTGQGYFACWGKSCRKGMEKKIGSVDKIYLAMNKEIPNDKYLVVSYDGGALVYFSMFDMNPYYLQDQEKRRREVERGKQSIKF